VLAAVNRPGEVRLELGGETRGGLTASAAGTVAGGWVGQWNGGSFRLKGHLHELLVYGRALSDAELASVGEHLASRHRALRRGEDRFIAFEGDSITQGVGASSAEDFCYPAQLGRRMARQPKWINLATGGDTIQNMAATASVLTGQMARNGHYVRRLAILLAGSNDINNARSAAQVIADMDAWIAAVRAADPAAVPVGCTVLPRIDYTADEEAVRQAVNAHIRLGANFGFVIDLAADPRLGSPGNAAIYGDGVHPTDAGYAIVAELVQGALAARGYD
jgi:lysophospholipase L1-like esterase